MIDRNKLKLIALIVFVFACAGFKGYRYQKAPANADSVFVARLDAVLAKVGWTYLKTVATKPATLSKRIYTSRNCAHALTIVVIGQRRGLEALVRLNLGEDVGFIQNGRVLTRPDASRHLTAKLGQFFRQAVGQPTATPSPLIAVAPAPRPNNAHRCTDPVWKNL